MGARTPFYEQHVAAGGKIVEFAGWDLPVTYSGLIEEHLQVRQGVGVFDVSHMGEVVFRGPKALDAIQWLSTNDASTLGIGQAQYAAMCNEKGGIVDDIFVYRRGEQDFLVVVNAANRAKDVAWMKANNPHGAEIDDQSDQWALLAVQGPDAWKVLQPLVKGADVAALQPRGLAVGVTVAGVEGCLVGRTGYTGEDGFEVFAPWDRAAPIWAAILETGADSGILPCGLGARDTLRLEVRNALYGHELNDETSPFQANLAFVTKLDKAGGFLGADAVRARKGNDPRRLVGILLDGKRIARDGMTILGGGKAVGIVTSGTRSPSLDRSIAMAYVDRELAEPGMRLEVDVRGKIEPCEVVRGPFYRRPQ